MGRAGRIVVYKRACSNSVASCFGRASRFPDRVCGTLCSLDCAPIEKTGRSSPLEDARAIILAFIQEENQEFKERTSP